MPRESIGFNSVITIIFTALFIETLYKTRLKFLMILQVMIMISSSLFVIVDCLFITEVFRSNGNVDEVIDVELVRYPLEGLAQMFFFLAEYWLRYRRCSKLYVINTKHTVQDSTSGI